MQVPPPEPDSVSRRTWWALLATAAAITLLATPRAAELTINTDLSALLPQDSAATTTYQDYLRRFGGLDHVFVIVETRDNGDQAAVIDAAEQLAVELEASSLVGSARAGLTPDDQRFLIEEIAPRLFLLAAVNQREEVERRLQPDAIRNRLRWMRARIQSPLTPAWESRLFAADPFGFVGIEKAEASSLALGADLDLASGSFLSDDGRAALVVVKVSSNGIDSGLGQDLLRDIDRAVATVQADTSVDLNVAAVGGPLYAAYEERAVRQDLTKSIFTSALAITALLFLYFGRSPTPVVLTVSVFAGLVWTAAVPTALYGGLNAIGISFGSILLGLGVDYGIHGAVAFHRQVMQGGDTEQGMRKALREVLPAISASVATTATGFLVLSQANFVPLRELGVIVGAGVLLMAAAFFFLGAPLIVVGDRARQARRQTAGPLWRPIGHAVGKLSTSASRHPLATLLPIGMVTLLALAGLRDLSFSADPTTLRSDNPSLRNTEDELSKRFGLGPDTVAVVVEAPSLDAALFKARKTSEVLRQWLPRAAIDSPSDWLLDSRAVQQILCTWSGHQQLLTSALRTFEREQRELGFAPDAFASGLALIRRVAAGETPPPILADQWPEWLVDRAHQEPQRVRLVVHGRGPAESLDLATVQTLSESLPMEVEGTSVAAIDLVGAEMQGAVVADLQRLGLWCALAVVAVVLVSFRCNLASAALALLPVLIGCTWLLGLCSWLGITLTPVAAMVLPVVIGLGVDDGLHVVHGRRVHATMERSELAVGGAMLLTTATTCLAFGSLLLSRIPALRQGGALVALGTAFCLTITLTVLPAIESLRKTK